MSLENCAVACGNAGLSVAGVEDGARCFCGLPSDLGTATATALSRPKTECMGTPCRGDLHEPECGGPNRLLAYDFSCSPPPPPPPPPPTPPLPPPPPVKPRPSKRSVMIWFLDSCRPDGALCNATGWGSRIATIKAHAANFTAVSPPLYNIAADGSFARIPGDGSGATTLASRMDCCHASLSSAPPPTRRVLRSTWCPMLIEC